MNKEPELLDLVNWLRDFRASWYQLGVQLKVPEGTLKVIEQNLRGQVDRQFSEVLNKWDNGRTSPHTFSNLLECLKKLDDGEKCVHEIKKKLKDPVFYKKYNLKQDYE